MFDAELDDVLRKTVLFSPLTAEEREELEAIGRVVRARAGSTLIRQGDEAGGMSVVVAGRVRIELELPDGRRETLATLSRGDVFGELSLVDRFPRSASAVADSDARVFLINGTEFDRLRHAFRPAAYKILRGIGPVLCKRLRAVDRAISQRMMERRRERQEAEEAERAGLSGSLARHVEPKVTFDVDTVPPLMGTPQAGPVPPRPTPEARVATAAAPATAVPPVTASPRLATQDEPPPLPTPAAPVPLWVDDEMGAEVVELSDSGLIPVDEDDEVDVGPSEPEAASEPQPEPEPAPKARPKAKAKTKPKAKAKTKPKAKAKEEGEGDEKPKAKAKAKPKAKAKSKAKPKAKPKSKAKADDEAKPKTRARSKAKAKPKAAAKSKSKPKAAKGEEPTEKKTRKATRRKSDD